ncbi:sensor histidine kinase [Longispora sp. K20-0274]|uniref:sensor histidine kinase n=1 Tax=Longispora sp. K20-0274 TaxID=3088255 RepID=UPI00399B4B41
MTTPGALMRATWSARTWLGTAHLLVGLPVGVATTVVILTLVPLIAGFAITVVPAIALCTVLLTSLRVFTSWQRSRFQAFCGVDLAEVPVEDPGLLAAVRRPSTWRQFGYHTLAAVPGVLMAGIVAGVWSVGFVFSTALLHGWLLPARLIAGLDPHDPVVLLGATAVGLLALLAAPWIVRALVIVDVAVAKGLLQPSHAEQLAERVAALSESRADVVDAADAERRRIERDLHDGTQQRLVSLAMNLGITRATLGADVPESARVSIAAAHEEAKQALVELRDFIRGLHPAVLDDRGLDAALSGIAARSPVPVRLKVGLDTRPSRVVEAVAYFVVSEALTNVAKHAQATRIDVSAETIGDRLWLVIADDGVGGARQEKGSGLRGLAQRVGSVDGRLKIDSPLGGPTLIVVELPCAS